jgi:hypothetical protein
VVQHIADHADNFRVGGCPATISASVAHVSSNRILLREEFSHERFIHNDNVGCGVIIMIREDASFP